MGRISTTINMNLQILNQYNVEFKKTSKLSYATALNFNLGVLISNFRSKENVEQLVDDINLA